MKTCFEVLDELEKISATSQKIKLLQEHKNSPGNNGETLESLLVATFDYRRTYLIKSIPENLEPVSYQFKQSFEELLKECEKTGRTLGTKQLVETWLGAKNRQEQKWYRRIILRDLRCGVNSETAIKAGMNIPVFEVQLATDSKKCKKLNDIIKKGVWISPKLDGYRCLAVGVDGNFTLYSRNGTIYQNFPTIKEELERLFPAGEHVFDGEIMSDSFNNMQKSAFASKRGTTVGDVKYFIFDIIPHQEWISGRFVANYDARWFILNRVFFNKETDLLKVVAHYYVENLEQARQLQSKFESEGYEGAMCNPRIPYYTGRKSNALLKFKSMLTWDCEIIGFEEGQGRLSGTLGKVVVIQENDVRGEVGSGFTDEDRNHIWNNKEEFLGKKIEVKFQELTGDQQMRFPVFVRFRDDKGVVR